MPCGKGLCGTNNTDTVSCLASGSVPGCHPSSADPCFPAVWDFFSWGETGALVHVATKRGLSNGRWRRYKTYLTFIIVNVTVDYSCHSGTSFYHITHNYIHFAHFTAICILLRMHMLNVAYFFLLSICSMWDVHVLLL